MSYFQLSQAQPMAKILIHFLILKASLVNLILVILLPPYQMEAELEMMATVYSCFWVWHYFLCFCSLEQMTEEHREINNKFIPREGIKIMTIIIRGGVMIMMITTIDTLHL